MFKNIWVLLHSIEVTEQHAKIIFDISLAITEKNLL